MQQYKFLTSLAIRPKFIFDQQSELDEVESKLELLSAIKLQQMREHATKYAFHISFDIHKMLMCHGNAKPHYCVVKVTELNQVLPSVQKSGLDVKLTGCDANSIKEYDLNDTDADMINDHLRGKNQVLILQIDPPSQ